MNGFKKKALIYDYKVRMKELEKRRFIRRYLEEDEELAGYLRNELSDKEKE